MCREIRPTFLTRYFAPRQHFLNPSNLHGHERVCSKLHTCGGCWIRSPQRLTERWVADIDCAVQSLPVGSLTAQAANKLAPPQVSNNTRLTPLRPALQPPSD